MTALFRFLIGGVGLLAVAGVVALEGVPAPLIGSVLASLGGTALVVAALAAGLLVERRRKWQVEVVADVLGVGLLGLAVGVGCPLLLALVVLVEGLVTRFAAGLLSRAAWRRAGPATGDVLVDGAVSALDRALHGAAIGFAAGPPLLGLVAAATEGTPGGRDDVGSVVVFGIAFGLIGAVFVLAVQGFELGTTVQLAIDPDREVRRRIARTVLLGQPEFLSGDEERVATRYSRFAGRIVTFELIRMDALLGAMLLLASRSLLTPGSAVGHVLDGVGLAIGCAVLVAAIPFSAGRIRRARDYAAAHGVSVA